MMRDDKRIADESRGLNAMKLRALTVTKALWWLLVAFLPISIHALSVRYSKQIGCPESGDCYVPGADLLLSFDILVVGSASLLWPVCFWFLGGGWLVRSAKQLVQGNTTKPFRED